VKKILIFIFVFLILESIVGNVSAQIRYATCDLCGYCQTNPTPPQSWPACQRCLYPNIINNNPLAKNTLIVEPTTGIQVTTIPGKQYTFLGCLGGGTGFTGEGSAGSVIQSLLKIVFSLTGAIAFFYLLYGSFVITTSQANPEKLNYGKRVVYGAIAGLIFTLGSVLIVQFIASGVLKIPGF